MLCASITTRTAYICRFFRYLPVGFNTPVRSQGLGHKKDSFHIFNSAHAVEGRGATQLLILSTCPAAQPPHTHPSKHFLILILCNNPCKFGENIEKGFLYKDEDIASFRLLVQSTSGRFHNLQDEYNIVLRILVLLPFSQKNE